MMLLDGPRENALYNDKEPGNRCDAVRSG